MKSIKLAIPSMVTSLAILAGCISITYSSLDNITLAAYFIIAAAVLDFFDGFLARSLKAVSSFGKQFDSLSDVINFGLAPAMIMYRLIYRSLVVLEPSSQFNIAEPGFAYYILLNCSFLIALFAAIRLAKFNIDDEQVKSFKGLPSPANALFILSIGVASEQNIQLPGYSLTYNTWFLLGIVFLMSVLMVSNIRLFALKFENYTLKSNLLRYIFILLSFLILLFIKFPDLH
ncbi:MAG: hypothetical protein HC906_12905 [Bacteroidales bacterium]|nr:hypothetical protein [Bacteroidales bacterium]